MTFPLMTILDAYIRKFDIKYPNMVFDEFNTRLEKVGKINNVDIGIPVIPGPIQNVDGYNKSLYMLYGTDAVKYLIRRFDNQLYIYHNVAGMPVTAP